MGSKRVPDDDQKPEPANATAPNCFVDQAARTSTQLSSGPRVVSCGVSLTWDSARGNVLVAVFHLHLLLPCTSHPDTIPRLHTASQEKTSTRPRPYRMDEGLSQSTPLVTKSHQTSHRAFHLPQHLLVRGLLSFAAAVLDAPMAGEILAGLFSRQTRLSHSTRQRFCAPAWAPQSCCIAIETCRCIGEVKLVKITESPKPRMFGSSAF